MSARLDVPALLRRAELGVSAARASCECPSLNGRMCGTCAHADEDERFLARLADAVEEWQKDPMNGKVRDLMVALKSSLAEGRILAILRGEVER